MANFNLFILKLLKHEGGYANVKSDLGGETYRGIARKFHQTWIGWKAIDAKKAKTPIKHNSIFPELESLIQAFYKTIFWNKIKADAIVSQNIAEFYRDFFVNSGANAHRKVTEALKELGVVAINKANPESFKWAFLKNNSIILDTNKVSFS